MDGKLRECARAVGAADRRRTVRRALPVGSRVIFFSYGTHCNPDFWDAPERFDSNRWLHEGGVARDPYVYLPLASCHRICLGNSFLLLWVRVVALMLAQRFNVRLKPGHQVRFDIKGVLVICNGLSMLVVLR